MRTLDFKSAFAGFVIGALGITTVFAANGIKSATPSNTDITLDGVSVPLNNSLVAIEKDGEKNVKLYIPVREVFEYLGYTVDFNSNTNTLKLISPKDSTSLPAPPSIPSSKSIPMSSNIPEHFTSGGIAKTTNDSNTYTYEGVIGAEQYQFGNPFPAATGNQLTFTLNSLEYVSGEAMEEDDSVLRVDLGTDNTNVAGVRFGLAPKTLNGVAASFPAKILNGVDADFPDDKAANHHITISNYSDKEVRYNFTLTIK